MYYLQQCIEIQNVLQFICNNHAELSLTNNCEHSIKEIKQIVIKSAENHNEQSNFKVNIDKVELKMISKLIKY